MCKLIEQRRAARVCWVCVRLVSQRLMTSGSKKFTIRMMVMKARHEAPTRVRKLAC